MAIQYEQIGRITYNITDVPLPTEGHKEGVMGWNPDTGDKVTFKDGAWEEGWYQPYITFPEEEEDEGGSGDLGAVAVTDIIPGSNGVFVRSLSETLSFTFTDSGSLNLGNIKLVEAELILTRNTLDLLCTIKSFRISDGVFDYGLEYYGYDEDINITSTVINGELILLLAAPGPVSCKVYVKTIIE